MQAHFYSLLPTLADCDLSAFTTPLTMLERAAELEPSLIAALARHNTLLRMLGGLGGTLADVARPGGELAAQVSGAGCDGTGCDGSEPLLRQPQGAKQPQSYIQQTAPG